MTNPNSDIQDSLPYYDRDWNDHTAAQVEQMIQDEMETFEPRPLPPQDDTFASVPFLFVHKEMERISKGIAMPKLDTSRYELKPAAIKGSVEDWENCVQVAGGQLEHQNTRVANLELLQKYGQISWKANATACDKVKERLDAELKETQTAVDDVNKQRKSLQMEAAPVLDRQAFNYRDYAYRNTLLTTQCAQLEKEAKGV